VLQLDEISYTIDKDGEDFDLIHKASLKIAPGHFMAIVGPSGCGKTTLLKIIAGLYEESDGHIYWDGRDLAEDQDLEPAEIGYVPQFSIAYDHLTVEESIVTAIRLRMKTRSRKHTQAIADEIMRQVGLRNIRDNLVKVISGGQKRRLGLALELVSNPTLLLCDEVTSGLDPKAEREIVHLMHGLAQSEKRVVINVTHSLSNLELYDTVLVMYQGCIVFHGPPRKMPHYFSVEHPEEVYPRLAKRSSRNWHDSWAKHRDSYYKAYGLDFEDPKTETSGAPATERLASTSTQELDDAEERIEEEEEEEELDGEETRRLEEKLGKRREAKRKLEKDEIKAKRVEEDEDEEDDDDYADSDLEPSDEQLWDDDSPAVTPGAVTQFFVLLERRLKIFFRDRTQVILHLAMLFGFPLIVILFGLDGVPQPRNLSDGAASIENVLGDVEVAKQNFETGVKISGLIMFQVILLALMGSNNSAREIASERLIFEKEKLGGLAPSSYLMSKVTFLGVLVLVQSIWMGLFVQVCIPSLPGDALTRIAFLILVNGAMTAICLGISAMMRNQEQSTLLSVYLVGFQLPLSGAVLALPGFAQSIIPPFISAFWGWGGILADVNSTEFTQSVTAVTTDKGTAIFSVHTSMAVLAVQIIVGIIVAYIGTKRHQWDQ
jgi:ABC-type multidrug transport system ATPase subunit